MKIKRLIIVMLIGFGLLQAGCSCKTWTDAMGESYDEKCADHWNWKKPVAKEPVKVEQRYPCAAPTAMQTIGGSAMPAGGAITLTKLAPKEVVLNKSFDYRLKVTNVTDSELTNVVVTDVKPANMRFTNSSPEMKMTQDEVRWELGSIAPKASKTISVEAVAVEAGTITSCARVTYDTATCAQIQIVQPKLRLAKMAPEQSLMCDRIPIEYVVTNIGTGYDCDINIKDSLGTGLMTAEGKNDIMFTVDSLAPDETRKFKVMVDPERVGTYSSNAIAMSQNGGTVESNTTTTRVQKPILEINEGCPSDRYIGRTVTYDITVTNRGDAIAKNTVVEAKVPDKLQFNNATDQGKFTHFSPGKVTWDIGSLEPGDSRTVTMTLTGNVSGELISEAMAKAYCADSVTTTCRTLISGIPAMLLEVIDVEDPIEIGQDTTYIIIATNQGSSDATNIRITCMLEEGMQYVTSTGPTKAEVVGETITFAPLSSLAPKGQAKWQMTVKASSVGDKRFKAMMNTEQLVRPVEETEATRFYE